MFPGPTMAAMLMPRRVTATTVVRKPNVPVNGTRRLARRSGGTPKARARRRSLARAVPVIAPGVHAGVPDCPTGVPLADPRPPPARAARWRAR